MFVVPHSIFDLSVSPIHYLSSVALLLYPVSLQNKVSTLKWPWYFISISCTSIGTWYDCETCASVVEADVLLHLFSIVSSFGVFWLIKKKLIVIVIYYLKTNGNNSYNGLCIEQMVKGIGKIWFWIKHNLGQFLPQLCLDFQFSTFYNLDSNYLLRKFASRNI